MTDAGVFRPVFASALALLARSPQERATVLAQDRALGFNGVRIFAGDLGWAGQTTTSALRALPAVLEDTAAHGLYAYISALTGTAIGYDAEAHLRAVARLCWAAPNCLLQIANEPYHPTQSSVVQDPAQLLALARRAVPPKVIYDLGAAGDDGPDAHDRYAFDGGAFNSAHLSRGGGLWNQLQGLRRIARVSEVTGKPAMSGEPIGAAEVAIQGRRAADPAFFFAMGALCRILELGCVFHSEDGLHARPLGENQRACAEAFLEGWRSIRTADYLSFQSTLAAASPVRRADFKRVVGLYTAVAGDRAWSVLVGLSGDVRVQFRPGWRRRAVVARQPGVQVWALQRRRSAAR